MRVNTSHFPLSFNRLHSWISSDRLAYLLILFTLAMGAMTAYVLANADYVSDDTDSVSYTHLTLPTILLV